MTFHGRMLELQRLPADPAFQATLVNEQRLIWELPDTVMSSNGNRLAALPRVRSALLLVRLSDRLCRQHRFLPPILGADCSM